MTDPRIKSLLDNNDIEEQHYNDVIYEALINGIFETICKEIKRQHTETEELSKFRRSKDHAFVTKQIVKRYVGCKLSDAEYDHIYYLLRAFFNKKSIRKAWPSDFKIELLNKQHNKCPFCGASIDLSNSHLDHIIPWDFVGDELDNNYQMLCVPCNERKGRSSYFEFATLLYKRC